MKKNILPAGSAVFDSNMEVACNALKILVLGKAAGRGVRPYTTILDVLMLQSV